MKFSLPTPDNSNLDCFIQQIAQVPDDPDERAFWTERQISEERTIIQKREAQFEPKAEQMHLVTKGVQAELLR